MLDLYFEPLFLNLRFCNPMDLKSIDNLSVALNEGESLKIEDAWDSLLNFFSDRYPVFCETVQNMKADLFMSLYSMLFYTTVSPTSKNEIARQISPIIGLDPKDCEKNLDRNCQELRNIYYEGNGKLRWNQFRKNNNLFYFQPFWIPFSSTNLSLKVFDAKDFYLYMTNYRHWPFFFNNQNGMLLCDYYGAVKGLDDKLRKTSKTGIDEQLSFFVFEQLFSPCRLSNLLTAFCNVFEETFYDVDSPIRERAIIFSSVLAGLPAKFQNRYAEDYLNLLKKYLYHLDNEFTDRLNFEQQLSFMLYCSSYIFPFAQSILLYFIFCAFVPREILQKAHHFVTFSFPDKSPFASYMEEPLYPESIFTNNLTYLIRYAYEIKGQKTFLNILKDKLKDYIMSYPEEFDYSSFTQLACEKLSAWNYPVKDNLKTGKVHNISEKIRNNVPIESFDYNFTYNFFSSGALFHVFDRCQSGNIISSANYNAELCSMFFNLSNNICNIYTANFVQQKNPRLLISGTIV